MHKTQPDRRCCQYEDSTIVGHTRPPHFLVYLEHNPVGILCLSNRWFSSACIPLSPSLSAKPTKHTVPQLRKSSKKAGVTTFPSASTPPPPCQIARTSRYTSIYLRCSIHLQVSCLHRRSRYNMPQNTVMPDGTTTVPTPFCHATPLCVCSTVTLNLCTTARNCLSSHGKTVSNE